MSFYIKQQFIKYNNPNEGFINLKGIVIHSTANIGATAQNHYNYWNSEDRQSSVHYIVDWNSDYILQFIQEDRIAWHTGNYNANREWLGIELCETNSKEQFNIVWNKTVWFVANLCIRYGWNVDDNVWSHNGLRSLYSGIDHTDPYNYLQRMGKTWQQLCTAINNEIIRQKGVVTANSIIPIQSISNTNTINSNNNQGDDFQMEYAVLGFSLNDLGACMLISQKYGNCAIYFRNSDKTFNQDCLKANTLFVVGGTSVGHKNEKLLSGLTAKDTLQEVLNAL